MNYLSKCLENLKRLEVIHHANSSVSVYHPKEAHLVTATAAKIRAEDEFQRRAKEQ